MLQSRGRPSLKDIVESIKNDPRPFPNRPVEKAPLRYRLKCQACEGEFGSSRIDARYCSSKCRQQAYRWRWRGGRITEDRFRVAESLVHGIAGGLMGSPTRSI